MLVLTRKLNEGIVVDGDVEITVLQVRGNRIRLGIRAPEHVSIRRGELSPLGPKPLAKEGSTVEIELPSSND